MHQVGRRHCRPTPVHIFVGIQHPVEFLSWLLARVQGSLQNGIGIVICCLKQVVLGNALKGLGQKLRDICILPTGDAIQLINGHMQGTGQSRQYGRIRRTAPLPPGNCLGGDADFLSQGALGQAGLFPIVCNLTSQLLNYF